MLFLDLLGFVFHHLMHVAQRAKRAHLGGKLFSAAGCALGFKLSRRFEEWFTLWLFLFHPLTNCVVCARILCVHCVRDAFCAEFTRSEPVGL